MKIIKEIISLIKQVLIAFIIAITINIFILQPVLVYGSSMEPTLHDKDKIVISKLTRTFNSELNYGDIIVIDSRLDRERTLIDDIIDSFKSNIFTRRFFDNTDERIFHVKRVIGKPGDVLEFYKDVVYRNGIALEEDYISEDPRYFVKEKITIPEGYIFIMGDNRNNSKDSRQIGCVPYDHVIGKLLIKF
ncbi:signal peptidase I [Alkaliphilus peptidifermentans]|uniref:Signal peptidase I n=1 Tax=Alkaliphilus peptidifermentans DSM 18978 TaxID=1120976 RepID=A0A1G5D7D4_9FIRM|nr:signal peptidase I [Alkaliphilus peptidifermentans]SCY10602.1 signal peptidase I [Alkaliphilus peptidifermentans DSM 18978]